MKIAFVSLPKIGDRFMVAEDCCCNPSSIRVLPSLLLMYATSALDNGLDVHYVDASIDETVNLSEFDAVVYCQSWLYHNEIHEAVTRLCSEDTNRIVIATQPGYLGDYTAFDPSGIYVTGIENMLGVFGVYAHGCGSLSRIDYSLVPKRYWQHYKSAIYQVTSGCPYRCKFCAWGGSTVGDLSFTMQAPSVIAHDITSLKKLSRRNIPISLLSSQLTTSEKWLVAFADEMEGLGYKFASNVNFFDLTQSKLDLLMRAGCVGVSAGIEGLSDSILKRIGKPFTFDQALDGIRLLSQSGISYRLHFRFGFGESGEEIDEEIANLEQLAEAMHGGKTKGLSIGPLIHYKGTRLYRDASYGLTEHPDEPGAFIQADIDWHKWKQFTDKAKALGVFRKYRRMVKWCG